MKFLKQTQRPRACRKFAPLTDLQNIPPQTKIDDKSECGADSDCFMELEESQPLQKEEQLYHQEIITFLTHHEETLQANPNYFQMQPDITEHMRGILLNWIMDVHLKYRLQTETLFLAVHLLDGYLNRQIVNRNQLQLVGITVLWIAAKYQETYQVPKIESLVLVCDSAYSKAQILEMQSSIISNLNFAILNITSYQYFQCLHQILELSPRDYFLSQYLLELSFFIVSFRKYHPRTVAASVVFFVNKLRKKQECWNGELEGLFELREDELKPCAREICSIWHKVEGVDIFASVRSKFMKSQFKEVGKIKMGPVGSHPKRV